MKKRRNLAMMLKKIINIDSKSIFIYYLSKINNFWNIFFYSNIKIQYVYECTELIIY